MKPSIEDVFELSPMQHGLLFEGLGARDPGQDLVQLVYELGDLDAGAFERAWRAVVDRHAMLRASFQWEDLERPLQVIHREVPIALEREDWSDLSPAQQDEALARLLGEDRERGVAFDVAPLYRLVLVRRGASRNWFLWSFHHVLFEGWSASVVLRDLLALYEGELGSGRPAPAEPPRYRDYIEWIQEQDLADAERFWREELAGFRSATPLPGRGATASSVHRVEHYDARHVQLSRADTEHLTAFARAQGITLNTLLQGAWALLLARTGGETDVVFGTMVSGRGAPLPRIEETVGLFVNLLPSRVRVEPRARVADWLRSLQARQTALRAFEHVPLVQVKEWSEVSAGQPLFESLVVFENWRGNVTLEDGAGPLEVCGVRGHHGGPGFPLSFLTWPADELLLTLSYDSGRFDSAAIERLLGWMVNLLHGLAHDAGAALQDVPLLTGDEERALLRSWNAPLAPLPEGTCVHRLIEAEAESRPEVPAVSFRGETLTYAELNRRANRLAHRLRALGVGPESRVGVCLERSVEMVVAILGVWKAGGAFVPLDPTLPRQRVAFVLRDSGVEILLTQAALAPGLPGEVPHVIALDAWPEEEEREPEGNPVGGAQPENLAFVTYTSGSTGEPKGSMVVHAGVLNAFLGWDAAYSLRDVRSHLVLASFAVDVFTADVVRALCSGGRLVLAPHEDLFSPARLAELLIGERIGYAEFVPHVLEPVVAHLEATGRTPTELAFLVVGSDVWLGSEWERARRVCAAETRLINAYGLNETSVDCTYFVDTAGEVAPGAYVPIGVPFRNHRVYVLDALRRPVPDGVPGELFVGGSGVVRGYWSRPGITAERFVPDPFAGEPGARMLATGDRVRRRPDGQLEVLGRVDQQVKVRAFRVEPGEIEHVLQEHPSVRQAVALVRADGRGEGQLVAYLVAGGELSAADARRHLHDRLPSYMVPAHFVFLEELPLTTNRLKVDRAALPDPDWSARQSDDEYVEPATETERRLAAYWLEVLPVERVGAHDRFMDLGGNSLLLVPVLERVEKELGPRLLPAELVLATLRQLATTVDARRAAQPAEAVESGRGGFLSRVFQRGRQP